MTSFRCTATVPVARARGRLGGGSRGRSATPSGPTWPLVCDGSRSFVSGGSDEHSRATSAALAAGDVDDFYVGQLAHPRELAAGEVARAALHRLDVAGQQLLEAQRLARGLRGARRVGGADLACTPAATIASTRASMRA